MTSNSHVVLLAAGKGMRFDSKLPKQFCLIDGRPVIFYTVEKFLREKNFENIILVVPEAAELQQKAEEALKPFTNEGKIIKTTTGGSTRQRSVLQGIKCLGKSLRNNGRHWQDDIVVIHDVVRPFVTSRDLSRVVSAAREYKAAGTVKSVIGTIVEMDAEDRYTSSCDRATHKSSESPQAFHVGTMLRCYEKCTEYDLDHVTDCFQITFKYGAVRSKLLRGDPSNMKITYPIDLLLASKILEENNDSIIFLFPSPNAEAESVTNKYGIRSCSINDYSYDGASEVVYLLSEDSSLLPFAENVLQQKFSLLKSVIFLAPVGDDAKVKEQDFRTAFSKISGRFADQGINCHAVITKDVISSIGRIKRALPLLSGNRALPNGQVLYF